MQYLRIQGLDLLLRHILQNAQQEASDRFRVHVADLIPCEVFEQGSQRLLVETGCCLRQFLLKSGIFCTQSIDRGCDDFPALRYLILIFGHGHQLLPQLLEPCGPFVPGDFREHLPYKLSHLLRICHPRIGGLSGGQIDLNIIIRVQKHDICHPGFQQIVILVPFFKGKIQLLHLFLFGGLLPLLNEILGDHHGISVAEKDIGIEFRAKKSVFGVVIGGLGVRLELLDIDRGFLIDLLIIKLLEVPEHVKAAFIVRNRRHVV